MSEDDHPEADEPEPEADEADPEADEADPEAEKIQPEVEWTPNFPRVRRIDERWYRAEAWLCGVVFLAMALMVMAEVIANTFVGRSEWIDVVILFGFCYLGARTRVRKKGETRMSQPRSLAIAVGLTVVVAAAIRGYVHFFPGGLVWTQKVALVALLWVALLGASMATYERAHLALELGEKLWPKMWLHLVKAFAHGLTSAFCIGLAWYSIEIVLNHLRVGTMVDPLEFPRWIALVILPYAFIAMGVRYAGQTYTIATKQSKPAEEQIPT